MITKQSIHYIILATLAIAAPVHSMGVFAAARARIGASLAEVAELGAYCKFMCSRKKNQPKSYGQYTLEEAILREAGIDKTIFDFDGKHDYRPEQRQERITRELHKAIIQVKQHQEEGNAPQAERWLCAALLIIRRHGSWQWSSMDAPIELAIKENVDEETLVAIWGQYAAIVTGDTLYREFSCKQFDDHRRKIHKGQQQAITQEIYDLSVTKALAKPLVNMIGEYAAEYPLMLERPLTEQPSPDLSADAACHTPIASA